MSQLLRLPLKSLPQPTALFPLRESSFLADKGCDVKSIYNTVKMVYDGEAFIPLNKCGTKNEKTLSAGNPLSAANLNTLAHISALAIALSAILSGSPSYRASKSFRRSD